MATIQVISIQDVLPITAINNIPGMIPRTVDIRGVDFYSVQDVLLNDQPSPSVVVMSSTQIYAQVPGGEVSNIIKSVSVLSNMFTATDASRINFSFTSTPQKAKGLQLLAQTYLLVLLTSPGSDAWNPSKGGGVQEIVGGAMAKQGAGSAVARFATAANSARSQTIALQARNFQLTDDERLAGAELLSSHFDLQSLGLLVRLRLTARSGRGVVANLEL